MGNKENKGKFEKGYIPWNKGKTKIKMNKKIYPILLMTLMFSFLFMTTVSALGYNTGEKVNTFYLNQTNRTNFWDTNKGLLNNPSDILFSYLGSSNIDNTGYNVTADYFIGDGSKLTGIEAEAANDTLSQLNCSDKEIAKYNSTSGEWECATDEQSSSGSNIIENNLYNTSELEKQSDGKLGIIDAFINGLIDNKVTQTFVNNLFTNDLTTDENTNAETECSGTSTYYSGDGTCETDDYEANTDSQILGVDSTNTNDDITISNGNTITIDDDFEANTDCSSDQSCSNVLYTSDEYIGGLSCSDKEVAIYNSTSGSWECGTVSGTNTEKAAGGKYLYNDSQYIYLNETELNSTIDNRDQYEANTDSQTLSVDSSGINDSISISNGNTIAIFDNFEEDTVIGNCSADGSCDLVIYESEYNASGYIKDWNSSGYIKNWNASGYIKNWSNEVTDTNNYVDGASFSGTDTVTLTLTREGLSDLTASFTDRYEADTTIGNCSGDGDCANIVYTSDEYLGGLSCADTEIAKYNSTSSRWECEGDEVGTEGSGEANDGSNIGTDGVGVYDGKSSVTLQFRNIATTLSRYLSLSFDSTDNDIDLDFNETELNNTIDSRDNYESDTNILTDNQYNTTQFENDGGLLHAVKSWWDGLYCQLTGCNMTGNLNMGNNSIININYTDHVPLTNVPSYTEGRLFYNDEQKTLSYYNDNSDVMVNIGEELLMRANNKEGTTIYDGQVVYVSGATGDNPEVKLAKSDNLNTSRIIGMVTQSSIGNNAVGYITTYGRVRGIDTSSYTEGDDLYVSPNTAGEITNIKPTHPNKSFRVGTVIRSHASEGQIFIDSDREVNNFQKGCVIFVNGDGELTQDCNFSYNKTTETLTVGNINASNEGELNVNNSDKLDGEDGSYYLDNVNNYTTDITFSGTDTVTLTLSREGMADLTSSFTDRYEANSEKSGGGKYLYNDTTAIYLNETELNNTIDDRDSDTTYSASGTLLDLTSETFSVNEGTLTDGKICKYVSGTGLVCDYDDQFEEDTNETERFNNLTEGDCSGTDKVVGVDSDGNVVCDTDVDTDTNTNIIDDNLYNTSELEEQTDGKLGIIDSFINGLINNEVTQTYVNNLFTDDLTVDEDTTYSAGDFLSLSGTTFNVADNWYDSISDLPTNTISDGDTTHIANNDQIHSFVTGQGYITDANDNVDSSELDNLCSTNERVLKRVGGTWGCYDDSNYLDNTDSQTLSTDDTNINDTITISNGNTITINDNYEANTDTNNYADGISFSGTDTKTLTLTRSGLSDLTASFTDRYEADTDTNANTECAGTDTYLSGDGTCETDTDTNTQLDDQPAEANVNMSGNNVTAVDCVKFSNGAKWCGT